MKCSECKFWQISKMYGNHCKFRDGVKPCERDRQGKQDSARRKKHSRYDDYKKKKMERYDKSMRKVRFDDN